MPVTEYTTKLAREFPWRFNTHGDESLQALFAIVGEYAKGLPCEGWLTLSGNPGCGKSHLALKLRTFYNRHHIYDQRARKVSRAVFADWPKTLGNILDKDTPNPTREMESAGLLVIDDVGSESKSKHEFSREVLFGILNHRERNGLPVVVTTNFDIPKLLAFDHRIADRLQRNGKFFRTDAGSYQMRPDAAAKKPDAKPEPELTPSVNFKSIQNPELKAAAERIAASMNA